MRNIIRGSLGDDVLNATETIRESLYGRGGDDRFVFHNAGYRGDTSAADPDFSDRFFGGRGADALTGLEIFFQNDASYDAYAQASFDGGGGTDSIVFDLSLSMRAVNTVELDRFSALTRSVEIREFDMLAAASTTYDSVIDILGDGGRETVRLEVQQIGEMTVNARMGAGADRFELFGDQDVALDLSINTGRGNDLVWINATTVHNSDSSGADVRTGNGADTIILEGMHSETVRAGRGHDDIYILTGSFADAPDDIYTGGGRDEIFVELDAYSQVATVHDFSAERDTIVFDIDETRPIEVVFDAEDWDTSDSPNLFMNNATGELFYGDNLMLDFGGPTALTASNFTEATWEF